MKDDIDALIDSAEQAYLQGEFEAAIKLAKKVVKHSPSDTSGLHILGCAAFASGDLKLARTTLRKLASLCRKEIAAAPDEDDRKFFEEILGTIGDDLVEQDGLGPRAARFLLDVAGVETVTALQVSAADALRREQWKPAVARLERLAVLKPDDGGVHYRLAAALARSNRKQPMLAALERAIQLDRVSVRAATDAAFKKFQADPALLALCRGPAADPKIKALYARLEEAEWEEVVAMGEPMLAHPTDALAVLEAMNDALENLTHSGAAGFEPTRKRIAAQLLLLKRAGARSSVYEEFLVQSLKD